MSHAPKLLALEAYASELLSPSATRHLERHLSGCAVCSTALAHVNAYARLREEARAAEEEVALPSWARLESALDLPREAGPVPEAPAARPRGAKRSGKVIALAWPLLAVAAALALAVLGSSKPDVAPSANVAPQKQADPRLIVGFVSLVAGSATLEQGATRRAITLDSQLREGDVLRTGPKAELHVQLSGHASGFALAPDSHVQIARLREGDTQLTLYAGRVASQVEKLSDGEQYQVWVDTLSASVRGTRFWVERGAGARESDVVVFVAEGRVEVARAGQLLAELAPGQGYPKEYFDRGHTLPSGSVHLVSRASGDAALPALPSLQETVGLILPALPTLRAFVIDGAAISAASTLAMRLPRGPTQLQAEDQRGKIRSVQLELNEPLTTLAPDALAGLMPKALPVGYLSAEEIAKVVRAGLEPLRRCYERSLRSAPQLEGKVTVRMQVSAEGRVSRAGLASHTKLPIELSRCIESEVQKLIFPKPEGGGPLSFEVPLNLKAGR